ncbi:MAG: glycosyltransferase family 4 protein [Candidatus Krumholzibacteriia bacterium]
MMIHIPAFGFAVGAALLALGAIPLARLLLGPARLLDVPTGPLQVHARPVPRLGGVGIFAAVALLLPFIMRDTTGDDLAAAIALTAGVFFLGLADDGVHLSARTRLAVQLALGAAAALLGFRPHALPFAADVLLAGLILVAATNALNWLDGLDGLAGGVAAIAAAALAVALHERGLPAWRDLDAGLCGALVAFLIYNLSRGRQKVFLGDCGSMSCGLLLALSAMTLSRGQHAVRMQILPWVVLAVPLLELGITVIRRALRGRSLLAGDRSHTYDVLIRHGVHVSRVVLLFWAAAALAGIVALGFLEV